MKTEEPNRNRGRRSSFCLLHSAFCTSDSLAVLFAVAAFAVISATMAVRSAAFLEADACTHFMYARAAWSAPSYLVNVWGRPLCTGLYAVPAHFGGRIAVRVTSLLVAVAIALMARSAARWQGWRWPALAVIGTFAQPLVFLHSFSELTELPFALLVAAAFLAYQRRRWLGMAVAVGLMPLSRPEGFGFLMLAAGALLLHRRLRWWPVLAVPLVGWDLAGWWLTGRSGHWWHWLADNWPYAGDSLYDRGYLLKYVGLLPAIVGPVVLPATLVGIGLCLRPLRAFLTDHRKRCEVLIAVLPLLILVGHSLLSWLGKMASNGEVRYMIVVAPFWALLTARGWAWAFDRFQWPHPRLWAGLAAALPLLANRSYTVLPQRPMPDWVEAEQIARWYKSGPISRRYPHIAVAHIGVAYALDLPAGTGRMVEWRKRTIDAVPPGTLLVWDYVNGTFNASQDRSIPVAEIEQAGWVPARLHNATGPGEWQFFHSPDVGASESRNSNLKGSDRRR